MPILILTPDEIDEVVSSLYASYKTPMIDDVLNKLAAARDQSGQYAVRSFREGLADHVVEIEHFPDGMPVRSLVVRLVASMASSGWFLIEEES